MTHTGCIVVRSINYEMGSDHWEKGMFLGKAFQLS